METSLPATLRAWFADRRRQLPWRVTDERGLRDPYRTWISEIMLQQTRVEAVIPFFENFMLQFDGPESLAAAEEEQVLKAWAGLGYYRRARMLHAASASLVQEHGGVFPQSSAELKSLPGIGAYTSAAIASLAFGERVPVVDGNVKRVVARHLALELAADDPKLERAARDQSAVWMSKLPEGDLPAAGQLNEALMELGATVCLPRNPLCESCPVAASCAALEVGRSQNLPLPKKVKKWVNLEMVFLVQRVGVRVLLKARSDGWSPGLYEPPSTVFNEQSAELAAAALLQELVTSNSNSNSNSNSTTTTTTTTTTSLKAPASSRRQAAAAPESCGVVRHTITNHRIRAHIFTAAAQQSDLNENWIDPETVPLTGLARKVLTSALL